MNETPKREWLLVTHDKEQGKFVPHLDISPKLKNLEKYTSVLLVNLTDLLNVVKGAFVKASSLERRHIMEHSKLAPHEIALLTEWPKGDPAIVPDDEASPGRGQRRKYSDWNLFEFLVARELMGFGLTVGHIKDVLEKLERLSAEAVNELAKDVNKDYFK
jgi:hypothetical protein